AASLLRAITCRGAGPSGPAPKVTIVRSGRRAEAGPEHVLDRELVEPHVPVPLLGRGVRVELLERGPVGEQVLVGLALPERGYAELVDPAGRERLGHL